MVVSIVFVAAATFALFFGGVFYRASKNDVPHETPATVAQTVPPDEGITESSTTQVPIDGQSYKVVRVFTGSIIEVADNNDQEYRISIFGIHAPKLNESFGAESKQNLSNLILGKTVFIRTRNSDGNEDFVAEVICGGLNAGIAQLQDGLVFPLNDQISRLSENLRRQYDKAELSARTNKYGIWSGTPGDISTTELSAAAPFRTGSTGIYENSVGTHQVVNDPSMPEKPRSVGTSEDEPVAPTRVVEAPKPTPVVPTSQRSDLKTSVPNVNSEVSRSSLRNEIKTGSSGSAYTRGPRGGCFYINAKGNKVYVDRTICN